jgi:predicted cobalt transporter CbtA
MKTLNFIAVTVFSGTIAGIFLGLINQGIVEPSIDKAIGIETQRQIAKGGSIDLAQQSQYRLWQKGAEVVAAVLYGISISSLFGIAFAYSRGSLPGSDNKKKTLFLSSVMFFVLFLVPALKYPANPPAVGNPATIYYREILYVSFITISGFSALALSLTYRRLKVHSPKKVVVPLIYAIIMISTYLIFPPNPDKVVIPTDLIMGFRIAAVFTIGTFWGVLGIIFGLLWDKFRLHETNKVTSSSAFLH